MKSPKLTKVKERNLHSIRIYLDDKETIKQLEKLASELGLSLSSVGNLIIRYGLPELEKSTESIRGQANDKKPK